MGDPSPWGSTTNSIGTVQRARCDLRRARPGGQTWRRAALVGFVELRALSRRTADATVGAHLELIAGRRLEDIGGSIPKTRAARLLGVSLTGLEKWIGRGAIPVVRRPGSSRRELETAAVVELAVEVRRLREEGRTRGVIAAALERVAAARPAMGSRDFFPGQADERRREFTEVK